MSGRITDSAILEQGRLLIAEPRLAVFGGINPARRHHASMVLHPAERILRISPSLHDSHRCDWV